MKKVIILGLLVLAVTGCFNSTKREEEKWKKIKVYNETESLCTVIINDNYYQFYQAGKTDINENGTIEIVFENEMVLNARDF